MPLQSLAPKPGTVTLSNFFRLGRHGAHTNRAGTVQKKFLINNAKIKPNNIPLCERFIVRRTMHYSMIHRHTRALPETAGDLFRHIVQKGWFRLVLSNQLLRHLIQVPRRHPSFRLSFNFIQNRRQNLPAFGEKFNFFRRFQSNHIPHTITKQALSKEKSASEIYRKFRKALYKLRIELSLSLGFLINFHVNNDPFNSNRLVGNMDDLATGNVVLMIYTLGIPPVKILSG